MPTYSALDVQMILELSNIMLHSASFFTKDQSENFDVYARLMTGPLHFPKDTAEYFLKTGSHATNRRVAFFINSTQAIIVEYSQLSHAHAQSLLSMIQTNQLTSIEKLMAQALPYLQSLYGQINFYSVGFQKSDPLLSQLVQLLNASYPSRIKNCSILMGLSQDAWTTEVVRRVLKCGPHVKMPETFEETTLAHHALCEKYLIDWFQQLEASRPNEYHAIEDLIIILLKYTQLQNQREKMDISNEALLCYALEKDHQLKCHYFAIDDAPEKYFQFLPLKALTKFLSLRDNPEKLIQELIAQQEKQYNEILTWENNLRQRWQVYQNSWGNWLWHNTKKSASMVYNNSPLGVGGGLATWLTKHAMPYINWDSSSIKLVRNVLKTSVKLLVFSTTLSVRLANYCGDNIELLLTKEALPVLTKSIGEDIAIIASLSLSSMSFLIMFMLPVITKQSHHLLKQETLHLKTAQIHSYEKHLPTLPTLLRINHLLVALSIAGYYQEYRFLIQAFMGTAGSIGMVRLGDAIFNEFKVEIPLTLEDRQYLNFLLSAGGMEIGNLVAETYYLVTQKIAAREAALTYLDQELQTADSDVTHYHATFPDLSSSPRMWFNSENPFRLFWVNNKNAYENHCQIISEVFSNTGVIECDVPHRITPLISA